MQFAKLNEERLSLIDKIFEEMGLHSDWELAERIYEGLGFVLENRKIIETTFPKKVIVPNNSSMWEHLQSTDKRASMKSLLAFARRLALSRHFAIVRKGKNVRDGPKKTSTIYSYKLLTT